MCFVCVYFFLCLDYCWVVMFCGWYCLCVYMINFWKVMILLFFEFILLKSFFNWILCIGVFNFFIFFMKFFLLSLSLLWFLDRILNRLIKCSFCVCMKVKYMFRILGCFFWFVRCLLVMLIFYEYVKEGFFFSKILSLWV